MREAIQGMLSMSRMGGLSGMQLFSRAESRRQAIKMRSSLAMEDEEEQLSKCYQDDEYGKSLKETRSVTMNIFRKKNLFFLNHLLK